MSGPPVGAAAYFVEVRPYVVGRSFEILSRTRILGWRAAAGQLLPVTPVGPVAMRAFLPSPAAPANGFGFVEYRAPSGERRWWNPVKPDKEMRDADMRVAMARLRDVAAA